MTMGEWAFSACHIPGSINVNSPEEAQVKLKLEDKIIVYCSDYFCKASHYAYKLLVKNGFTDVWLYSGGLADWQAAGYPLEGNAVKEVTNDQ